jgi:ubiquinone/menaquinone biosynthesis C-methylase UbiE
VRRVYEDLWRHRVEARLHSAGDLGPLRSHLPRGGRVLDLGSGAGGWIGALRAAGVAEVVAADVADAALEHVRERFADVATHRVPFDGPLPLARDEFDAVWCADVLEHVADTELFLTEARRVLKPGGPLLAITPDHPRIRTAAIALTRFERHFHPLGDHLRFYTKGSLADVLDDAGFRDVEIERHDGQLLGVCAS